MIFLELWDGLTQTIVSNENPNYKYFIVLSFIYFPWGQFLCNGDDWVTTMVVESFSQLGQLITK
jgi:hypothetical protein